MSLQQTDSNVPICPHCGLVVPHLVQTGEAAVKRYRTALGDMDWIVDEIDIANEWWLCPHCTEIIATNEEDADEFLMGVSD